MKDADAAILRRISTRLGSKRLTPPPHDIALWSHICVAHFFAYFCEKNKWVKHPSNHKKGRCKKSTSDNAMNVGTMPWACLQCVGTMVPFATATLEYIFL